MEINPIVDHLAGILLACITILMICSEWGIAPADVRVVPFLVLCGNVPVCSPGPLITAAACRGEGIPVAAWDTRALGIAMHAAGLVAFDGRAPDSESEITR